MSAHDAAIREKTEHLTPNAPLANTYSNDAMIRDHHYNNSGSGYHDLENNLTRTTTGMTLTPEMFERMYLNPKNNVAGSLRKTFGNPTPLAIVGFLLSLTPLSCILMGFRSAAGPAVLLGSYYYMGGMCMVIGGVLEFFLGNTFPFVVFVSFGGFWLSFAALNSSYYGIAEAYGATAAAGAATPGYESGLAFYFVFWGVVCFIYFIISLRTNVVFAIIFITVDVAFLLLAATYWQLVNGNTVTAGHLQTAAGAFAFACCMAGWYLLIVILLDSLDFPLTLPVGDLSNFIRVKSVREKEAVE
ncbi:putative Plasma membrane ammonium transporter [Taphrina deformans PYCC 5710]|uniref:Plasma membrane ammonium transporter n=1 Tax=Taphrina deformans (strain PYCC 5710 / ATCC 11124 / CBS 356.35 / IMI 108563 / JCM 9778 / NBRC 8474) TaxID=1097556 RepID=R4XCM6_TAPDE|nr:putative Plasma membrane ammonium transporter [Taphrina deformans PYCC 5710]|eukprot:CCG81050.1 putative Plasma membrane ammonium transporter [Taphrina deformans PYCC 5710]